MKDKHNLHYIDVVRHPIGRDIPRKISHYSCEHYVETYNEEGIILGLINGGQTEMEILIQTEDTEVFVMNINGKTLNVIKGEHSITKPPSDEGLQQLLQEVGIKDVPLKVIKEWDADKYAEIMEYTRQQYLYNNNIPAPTVPKDLTRYIK